MGTSSSARSGVNSGSNIRSSVTSLPATRSRVSRWPSRSRIFRYAFSSWTTGEYGVALS